MTNEQKEQLKAIERKNQYGIGFVTLKNGSLTDNQSIAQIEWLGTAMTNHQYIKYVQNTLFYSL